jgi:hypothetical protein
MTSIWQPGQTSLAAKTSRILFVGALVCVPLALVGPNAAADVALPSFSASASADGVRATVDLPGGPLADKLVDVGGPTAQVAVSTLGTSTAYAALPDPGQVVNSAPGLVVGLLNQGAYGLPPIPVPSLNFTNPLLINTDASSKPDGSLSAGIYNISAHSGDTSGRADASGGIANLNTASVAGLVAHADVTPSTNGSVTVTARSSITGLALGPITLGSITSMASETITADGTVTPKSETSLSALTLAGVPLPITLPLTNLDGASLVTTLTKLLDPLLKPFKISVDVEQITTTPGTVVAPTISITIPFPAKNLSTTGTGTLTLTIGGTSVSMTGAPAPPTVPVVSGPTGDSGGGISTGIPAGILPTGSPPPVVVPPAGPSSSPVVTPPLKSPVPVARATKLLDPFDVRGIYAALAALALIVFLFGHIVRLLGVRK